MGFETFPVNNNNENEGRVEAPPSLDQLAVSGIVEILQKEVLDQIGEREGEKNSPEALNPAEATSQVAEISVQISKIDGSIIAVDGQGVSGFDQGVETIPATVVVESHSPSITETIAAAREGRPMPLILRKYQITFANSNSLPQRALDNIQGALQSINEGTSETVIPGPGSQSGFESQAA